MTRYVIPRINSLVSRLVPYRQDVDSSQEADYSESSKVRIGSALLKQAIELIKANDIKLTAVQFWSKEEMIKALPVANHSRTAEIFKEYDIPVIQTFAYFYMCPGEVEDLFIDSIHPYTIEGQKCLSLPLKDAILKE